MEEKSRIGSKTVQFSFLKRNYFLVLIVYKKLTTWLKVNFCKIFNNGVRAAKVMGEIEGLDGEDHVDSIWVSKRAIHKE